MRRNYPESRPHFNPPWQPRCIGSFLLKPAETIGLKLFPDTNRVSRCANFMSDPMKAIKLPFSFALICVTVLFLFSPRVGAAPEPSASPDIFGFRDPVAEHSVESRFLAVPDAKLAGEHLRILTQAPHMAGTPEDKATADYVAQKFRAAGLETEITEYKVWMNYPTEVSVDITSPEGVTMHGPNREHVDGDPFQDDPRVVMPFNGESASGDVQGDVIYANYGTPEDFKKLAEMNIDVHGKILIMRYGGNFRGVKVLLAQEHGAAGVLIYSDPYDDGWRQGDKYPQGPWHPDTGVQRGSVGQMMQFPGDPTTPGIASLPDLPASKRTPPEQSAALVKIPSTPLSYADATPILAHLGGPDTPREWQGSLPFTYHVGPGPMKIHLVSKQDYQYRSIWDVTGRIPGSESPDEWVVAGNHRDAWVYGAVDPNSGTAAMLETVHGVGELLKSGWKPKRTIVFASWDAEEEGLMGSTEWAEQHASELVKAPAYLNMDVAVAGPDFGCSSVPSMRQFMRDVAKAVPSPQGGSVYDVWRKAFEKSEAGQKSDGNYHENDPTINSTATRDVSVGDLGSGSDYSPFLQHLGVPSTDVGSGGPYGVYHSAFDNYAWFTKFADPTFVYEKQMAGVFGIEAIRLADADDLPYDYEEYGKQAGLYVQAAKKRAEAEFRDQAPNFGEAIAAAKHFEQAGAKMLARQKKLSDDSQKVNQSLLDAERALLIPGGLPNRAWYTHSIYAPGVYTGYAAVVVPGVNEAIDQHNLDRMKQQLAEVTAALNRAAKALDSAR
jgi:N-acetylated-alpha-linked acidic dipeptidase